MPMLLALASPASSIRLASDNARVIEERGIALFTFLDAMSNRFGLGTRLRHGNLWGHARICIGFRNRCFPIMTVLQLSTSKVAPKAQWDIEPAIACPFLVPSSFVNHPTGAKAIPTRWPPSVGLISVSAHLRLSCHAWRMTALGQL